VADVPLLETKIHMPRKRRDVVARPRLDERLDPARLPALTLVSAPAGFGKTTVLAEGPAASGSDALVAWVSLDRRDNDPRLFWSYVVAAIRSVAGEVGATAATMLQDGASSIDLVLTTLLNDLGRVETEVVLVLDDVHLIESTEVHDSVRFLLEHVPPQVHLVLASRADPRGRWPASAPGASSSSSEARSCASPPTRRRPI
jgi:LuxR family maltose regulon positive regulatory protein